MLDANAGITAEPEAFGRAFNVTHASVISTTPTRPWYRWIPPRSINTSVKSIKNAKVLNYIPNQRAGKIAQQLSAYAGFVPVDPLTYGVAAHPNVHVIRDSCSVPSSYGKAVPKSGHMANSEARSARMRHPRRPSPPVGHVARQGPACGGGAEAGIPRSRGHVR